MLDTTLARGKHDTARRRAVFLEAATAVFAEKGFDCATTREIAARAACSEGLIHRYFGGKRGLLLAILEDRSANVARLLEETSPDRSTLIDEIEGVVASMVDRAWEQRDFMRVAVGQALIDPEIGRFIGARLNGEHVALIARKLERHRDAGRLRVDADIASAAQAIAGLAFEAGFFLQVVFARDREEVRRLVRAFATMMAQGLAASPERAGTPRSDP
jgi:AcrR family transcriptional regulator